MQGVVFHPVTGVDAKATAQVQTQGRQRLLRSLARRGGSNATTGTAAENRRRAPGLRERQAGPARQPQPAAHPAGTTRPPGRADPAGAPPSASLLRGAGAERAAAPVVTALAAPVADEGVAAAPARDTPAAGAPPRSNSEPNSRSPHRAAPPQSGAPGLGAAAGPGSAKRCRSRAGSAAARCASSPSSSSPPWCTRFPIHLGEATSPPRMARARGSPLWELPPADAGRSKVPGEVDPQGQKTRSRFNPTCDPAADLRWCERRRLRVPLARQQLLGRRRQRRLAAVNQRDDGSGVEAGEIRAHRPLVARVVVAVHQVEKHLGEVPGANFRFPDPGRRSEVNSANWTCTFVSEMGSASNMI